MPAGGVSVSMRACEFMTVCCVCIFMCVKGHEFMCMCVYECMYVCAHTCVWKSADNLQESVFSFYHVRPKNQTEVVRLGGKFLF